MSALRITTMTMMFTGGIPVLWAYIYKFVLLVILKSCSNKFIFHLKQCLRGGADASAWRA
jgi:hypothetical protein